MDNLKFIDKNIIKWVIDLRFTHDILDLHGRKIS